MTDPLVPADLDLRDFRWMKLDLIALFNSDFNATPDDTAWRAGVTLWGKAWHQVPAGSLPDDDATLCNLAGLGRDVKTWKKIRETSLRGFVRCSDGRLYHSFLCAMAVDAAEERKRYEERRARDRQRKTTQPSVGIPTETARPETAIPPEIAETPSEIHGKIPLEGEGQGQGQGEGQGQPLNPRAAEIGIIELFDHVIVETFGPDDARPWPNATDSVTAGRMLASGATEELLEPIFRSICQRRKSQGKRPPTALTFFDAIVSDVLAEKARPMPSPSNAVPEDIRTREEKEWWAYVDVWRKTGAWHGLGPRPNERGCQCPPSILAEFGIGEAA